MAFAEMHTRTVIRLVHTQIYAASDFQFRAKEAASNTGHSLHPFHSHIPSQTKTKITRRLSVVKNIIKVINLYLNRPLRVFFPLLLRWKRQWTRPSCSWSALCNSVHVDPFWDLCGGGSGTGSKSSSRVPVSTGALGVATLQFPSGQHVSTTVALAPMGVVRVSPADLYKCLWTVSQLPESVIWVRCWGWGRSRSSSVTGRGQRRTWGTSWGCTSPRCATSTAAPRSPWTVSCWPWTPSPGTPEEQPARWKVALRTKKEPQTTWTWVQRNLKKFLPLNIWAHETIPLEQKGVLPRADWALEGLVAGETLGV